MTVTWFVFMSGEEDEYSVTRHGSYRDAVFEAQCRGCTEKRPRRLHAGFYELQGCSGLNTYMIATPKAMKRQGYEDLLSVAGAA